MCSPVCEDWAKSDTLISRAGTGRFVLCPNEHLGREDLVTNEQVITPILKHLGLRTTIDQINEHVELFFEYSRPKGKPAIKRSLSKLIFFLIQDDWKHFKICKAHLPHVRCQLSTMEVPDSFFCLEMARP